MSEETAESPAAPVDLEAESGAKGSRHGEAAGQSDPRVEITKTLIKAGATVIVAGIGLLGPITTGITKFYEISVEDAKNRGAKEIQNATLKHQTEMDFLGRLIDTQELKTGEITRTFYRRDVLRFFDATLTAGPLHTLAKAELDKAEERIKAFDQLQKDRDDALAALESKSTELAGTKAADAAQLATLRARLDAASGRLNRANLGSQLAAPELKSSEAPAYSPAYSPDGKLIYTGDGMLIDARTGRLLMQLTVPRGAETSRASFSSDSKFVYTSDGRMIDARTGQLVRRNAGQAEAKAATSVTDAGTVP